MKACETPSRCRWSCRHWVLQELAGFRRRLPGQKAVPAALALGRAHHCLSSHVTSTHHMNRMASHLTLNKGLYCPEKQSVCLSRHNERALAYGRAPVKEHKTKDDFSQLNICHSLCAATFLKLNVISPFQVFPVTSVALQCETNILCS